MRRKLKKADTTTITGYLAGKTASEQNKEKKLISGTLHLMECYSVFGFARLGHRIFNLAYCKF